MERFLCIHGHFYQPPRENPWLESVEIQDSAHPYHDWNEKITMECYAPNSASRILDRDGLISKIVSNYSKISFNFGPTLLHWMENHTPEIYQAILDADRESMEIRSGHGNAIAQVYNHIIMPLANIEDKITQVKWGIADFCKRFKRYPEGMWLSETAVDIDTLEVLAESNIKFTILAPHQASKVRKKGSGKWKDVSYAKIDPTRAYICNLPSGKSINIFFYDGPISRAVAFEKLLSKGEYFAERLLSGYSNTRSWPQLVHIATDGETYGHHHKFGDMALAYTLDYIESNQYAKLTNYGEYLEKYPATHEVRICEYTSWSCAHGIERWRSDCGCNSGGNSHWNQRWREPMREAFDWLRDKLAVQYFEIGKKYFVDPWEARNNYIDVVLDRSENNLTNFFNNQGNGILCKEDKISAIKLLEMQRHLMLMYTSCGWFFDELSGLETVQVIQYAGRALQLSEEISGNSIEEKFIERSEKAMSNIPEYVNMANIYKNWVKPAMIDLKKVGVHYAVNSLFENYPQKTDVYCYYVEKQEYFLKEKETARMAAGKIYVSSKISGEGELLSFCVINVGTQMLNGGIRKFLGNDAYESMKKEMAMAINKSDFAEIVSLMDKHFGMHHYSFKDLFEDEKRNILNIVISKALEDFVHTCHSINEQNRGITGLLQDAGIPIPSIFRNLAEFSLTFDLTKAFLDDEPQRENIENILQEMKKWNIDANLSDLEFKIRKKIEKLMEDFSMNPSDFSILSRIERLIEMVQAVPIEINYWHIQNIYSKMTKTIFPEFQSRVCKKNEQGTQWIEKFKHTGEMILFNMKDLLSENV